MYREGTNANTAGVALQRLLADEWEYRLGEYPLFASIRVGDHRRGDRLPDESPENHHRRLAAQRGFLERLRTIDRDALTERDRVTHDVFERQKSDFISEYEHGSHLMPITGSNGFHVRFPELPRQVPLRDAADYDRYVARLAAFRGWTDQHIELMRLGIAEGRVLPSVTLAGHERTLEPHIVDAPEKSLLFAPFRAFPDAMPAAERSRLERLGRGAIADSVVPGFRRFLEFLREEYVPAAREEIGCSALPGGEEFYAFRVRRFTTLDVTPEDVHETGLREVARIRDEMDALIGRVGFRGGFAEFVEHLRADDRFYFDTPEELLREVAFILKSMDGKLPRLFEKLPRLPYGVEPVPDYVAPKTPAAYYKPGAADGSRAGIYAVNTYDLRSRPRHEVEALSLHEAVPGHHLQIALQQELDLPEIRRFSGFTAFVEGWALYAERLGLEVGFYEDPHSDFGRLTYEIWRACRLVIDTGIHAFGWTRRQAIDYMAENSALSRHTIETEIDRYIAWPGQAIAYKIGELKIRELRERAESALGARFDVREFHDVVLRNGAVPLTVLEELVESWIASTTR